MGSGVCTCLVETQSRDVRVRISAERDTKFDRIRVTKVNDRRNCRGRPYGVTWAILWNGKIDTRYVCAIEHNRNTSRVEDNALRDQWGYDITPYADGCEAVISR